MLRRGYPRIAGATRSRRWRAYRSSTSTDRARRGRAARPNGGSSAAALRLRLVRFFRWARRLTRVRLLLWKTGSNSRKFLKGKLKSAIKRAVNERLAGMKLYDGGRAPNPRRV